MQEELDSIKLVVALRTARAIVGWSQVEFAEKMGLSKSTVARLETKEADIPFTVLNKILNEYKEIGIEIDLLYSANLNISIEPKALEAFRKQLQDEENRRSDRGAPKPKKGPKKR
jgi:transcriptional regulator with XRE-family HTH domain